MKIEGLKQGDRVTVYWDDAYRSSGITVQTDRASLLKGFPLRTTGVVYTQDDTFLVLVEELDRDDDGRDSHSILWVNVTKVEKLRVQKVFTNGVKEGD